MTSSAKPRLAILSQNCFAQCDLPVIPALATEFDISWTIFFPRDDSVGYSAEEFEAEARNLGVTVDLIRLPHRLRSIRTLASFSRILKRIRSTSPDLIYVNATGHPWLGPTVRAMMPLNRVLWALHDVVEHGSHGQYRLFSLYKKFLMSTFRKFHALSDNQAALIRQACPGSHVFVAPHPPLDPGRTDAQPPTHIVRFLYFGNIAPYKGVDVLIEAAQIAWENGVRGFEVVVAGKADDWSPYQHMVRIPEVFRFDIRRIPTAEIPDLFCTSHWLVLPYRHLTQSGPLSMAHRYGLPAITSDLPQFEEFLESGNSSLSFRTNDASSLASILSKAVVSHATEYAGYRGRMSTLAMTRFSSKSASDAYLAMMHSAIPPSPLPTRMDPVR